MSDNGLRIEKIEADIKRLQRVEKLTTEYLTNLTDMYSLINDKVNDLKKIIDLQEKVHILSKVNQLKDPT